MMEQCPSLAHGFFPIIKLVLFVNGCKNLEVVSFPNYVSFPSGDFCLGSGSPITSKVFLIACD